MDWKSFYLFVLSVSMFVSISGEESRPHFCEELKTNKQIDYTLNVPQVTHFNNYIFINGHHWKLVFTPSGGRRKRQDDEQTGDGGAAGGDDATPAGDVQGDEGGAPEGDGGAPGGDGGAPGGDGGAPGGDGGALNGTGGGNPSVTTPKESSVTFKEEYGKKFPDTPFFDEKFKCAFAVKKRNSELNDNIIGGVTADFSTVRYIVANISGETSKGGGGSDDGSGGVGGDGDGGSGGGSGDKETTDGGSDGGNEPLPDKPDNDPEGNNGRPPGADTSDSDSERRKRQSNETESDPGPETASQPSPQTPSEKKNITIREFKTEFEKSSFKPQLAFHSFSRMDDNSIVFIETKKSSASQSKYESRIQGYNIRDPERLKWINVTGGSKQNPFRRRRQTTNTELRKVPPSVWSIVQHYYVKGVFGVKLSDQQNGSIILIEMCSSEDIPCSGTITYKYCITEDNEQDSYKEGGSCSPDKLQLLFDCTDWKPTTLPPPPGLTNPDGSAVTDGPSGGSGPPGGDTGSSPTPEPGKGGMTWLWILIILIIIIIIIIVIIFCFCCKKKSDKPKEEAAGAAAGAAGPPSGTGKPASGTGKPPSGTGSGGAGLEKSPSTLSSASTRSAVGSDGV